jgi:hypothetical protein
MNMQTIQKQLLLSFLIASSTTLLPANTTSIFDEMWQEMEQLHQRIEKRMSHMRNTMCTYGDQIKEASPISMKTTEAGLQISLPQIALKDRNFDAQFDQDSNTLTISTPSGTISILARMIAGKQTYISASRKQNEQTELDKDKSSSTLYTHSQISQTFEGEIEMGQAAIEYESEMQELIITIPQRKRKTTKIPIHFKEPKEDK